MSHLLPTMPGPCFFGGGGVVFSSPDFVLAGEMCGGEQRWSRVSFLFFFLKLPTPERCKAALFVTSLTARPPFCLRIQTVSN